jgi:hypothetical protein
MVGQPVVRGPGDHMRDVHVAKLSHMNGIAATFPNRRAVRERKEPTVPTTQTLRWSPPLDYGVVATTVLHSLSHNEVWPGEEGPWYRFDNCLI